MKKMQLMTFHFITVVNQAVEGQRVRFLTVPIPAKLSTSVVEFYFTLIFNGVKIGKVFKSNT